MVLYRESFDSELPLRAWTADIRDECDPFADDGVYFQRRGVHSPSAFRAHQVFGKDGWLTIDSYSRSRKDPHELAQVVVDPAGSGNRVLRLTSPEHTDATIVRPTQPLPERYRISVRVGYANFGDGRPGANGYTGGERAEPWRDADATTDNGFYWLAILDTVPGPHNNTWIHHHRKVVIDSDNHYPPWSEIFDGSRFRSSGEHPAGLFVIDGRSPGRVTSGKSFIPWAAGRWQPSGTVRSPDAYLPRTWYRAVIERIGSVFSLEIGGEFAFGGRRVYRASIDAAPNCIFHYNRPSEQADHCIDESFYPALGPEFPSWPRGASYPDYFMFGDPHENYYEGFAHYDDVTLEVWRP